LIYLDSSALLKQVRPEEESGALREWLGLRPEQRVATSELGRIEVLRTARGVGGDKVTRARAVLADVDLLPLDHAVQDLACDIGEPGLRSLDALHLASAVLLGEELTEFVAYDRRLARAARDAGLTIAAPGQAERAEPRGAHPLRLGFPVVGVVDMPRAVVFWTEALGLVAADEWRTADWTTLHQADGSGRALGLQRSESPVEPYPRVHLDLFTDTRAEQEAEIQRLVGLGAARLAWGSYPPDPDFVVLADPDGNPFCVVDLSRAPSRDKRAG
jgi:predicted nucleic acid-binding protein/catechol 2,3-dioxygenase-like lactoylglutathione lyase family enzyme